VFSLPVTTEAVSHYQRGVHRHFVEKVERSSIQEFWQITPIKVSLERETLKRNKTTVEEKDNRNNFFQKKRERGQGNKRQREK
jgi:hypothetical protein